MQRLIVTEADAVVIVALILIAGFVIGTILDRRGK
jgi:lipid-binding SYLF domain-containing protein